MYPIEGFPGYFIDKDGCIFSEKSRKYLKHISHSTGYCLVRLTNPEGIVKNKRVHRLLAETFLPNPEEKEYVNHIDGDKSNNQLENLEWVTHQENEKHAICTGLKSSKGVSNPSCRFSRKDVRDMLDHLKEGAKIKDVAKLFQCHHQTVSRLVNIEFPGVLEEYKGNWKKRFTFH